MARRVDHGAPMIEPTHKLPDTVIETWFNLRRDMLVYDNKPTALRPPSLRDACYAWALAMRSQNDTSPETIEAYVNGLELGALSAIQQLWKARK
jgi:hypothetical protein